MSTPNSFPSRQRSTSNPTDTNGHSNGNGNGNGTQSSLVRSSPASITPFDQPVVLKQAPTWSRAIVWTLMGVTAVVVGWACIAQVEEAVPAQGKLEPEGAVTEVQAPVGGVVKEVMVKDGDKVKQGALLVTLDPAATRAEQDSLKTIRDSLVKENEFYRAQMRGEGNKVNPSGLTLSSETVALTRNREALQAENALYRSQILGSSSGSGLTPEQQMRFASSQAEIRTRVSAAQLEVGQLQRQLEQVQSQLSVSRELLAGETDILGRLETLWRQGGIAQLQYDQQRQQVRTRQGEVERLVKEGERLRLAIAQSSEKVDNTVALARTDLLARITDNEKRIAEIDSQLTKAIVQNEKQIAETDAKLKQAQLTLGYQDVKAPVSGTVFDLKASNPGFVATTTTPILKIVPEDALTAKVFITNRDIGFVRENMDVDVRIDSFPFSEFGDVKGKLIWIGSDALPPDQVYPFYRFPAKVKLDRQSLIINNREVALQSGMSISTNIKIRKRPVISLFTDLFSKKVESLKFVR